VSDEAGNPLDGEDLVELYAAKNAIEADRVVRILEDDGVEALYRETTMSSFPDPAEAHYLVMVRGDQATQARDLIASARTDGVISADGVFISTAGS
jgi:hypothetical protein